MTKQKKEENIAKEIYNFPEYGITLEAVNLDEAIEKLSSLLKDNNQNNE